MGHMNHLPALNIEASALSTEQLIESNYVLLWSQSQNALHIELLSRMLDSNRRAYAENRRMDYVPLVIGNDDLCHDIARAVRGTLVKREAGLKPEVAGRSWL